MQSIIFVSWSMNKERGLLARTSLQSLVDSLDEPCEIIVVDNGESLEDSQFFLEKAHNKEIAHYLRNADNLHFAYARNQAMKLVTGDFIAIVDNDLIYEKGWLQAARRPLELYPDKKLTGTPIRYPDIKGKRVTRYDAGFLEVDGQQRELNYRAGSNCWIMTRKTMEEIGDFPMTMISGSHYMDKMVRAGYVACITPVNMVQDVGLRRGYNLWDKFEFFKTLSDKSKIKI